MRRPIAIALLAAAAGLAACAHERTEDAGPQVARNYPVGNFSKVEVAGPYDVRITTGAKPAVSATGPENVLDRLLIEVKGDTLQIHPKKDGFVGMNFRHHDPVVIEVSAQTLAAAAIAGSGDIVIDKVKGDTFKAGIAGSGSLNVGSIDVKRLEASIGGSGDVQGAGKATSAKYSIAGSGDINFGAVQTVDSEISVAGSGNVEAQASGTAKVSIVGSGDVRVTGGAKCDVSKMGSGDVTCS